MNSHLSYEWSHIRKDKSFKQAAQLDLYRCFSQPKHMMLINAYRLI